MSVRGDFRVTLQQHLEQWFDFTFHPGRLDGPSDIDVGCVWWEGKRPFARDGNLEENFYRAKVLRRFLQDQGGVEPRQSLVELLEDTAEQLEDALLQVLVAAGHSYFNVVEVTVNYQEQTVEAQLTAFDQNRSAAGG